MDSPDREQHVEAALRLGPRRDFLLSRHEDHDHDEGEAEQLNVCLLRIHVRAGSRSGRVSDGAGVEQSTDRLPVKVPVPHVLGEGSFVLRLHVEPSQLLLHAREDAVVDRAQRIDSFAQPRLGAGASPALEQLLNRDTSLASERPRHAWGACICIWWDGALPGLTSSHLHPWVSCSSCRRWGSGGERLRRARQCCRWRRHCRQRRG